MNRLIAVALFVLTLGGFLVVVPPAPSAALVGAVCPPGAPPNSTLCTPAGASVIADYAAMSAGAVATAAPAASTTGSLIITAGGAAVIGGLTILADQLIGSEGPAPVPGFTDGNNFGEFRHGSRPGYDYAVSVSGPVYEGSGTVTVTFTNAGVTGDPCRFAIAPNVFLHSGTGGGLSASGTSAGLCDGTGSVTFTGSVTNFTGVTAGSVTYLPQGHPERFEPDPADFDGQVQIQVNCAGVSGVISVATATLQRLPLDGPNGEPRYTGGAVSCPIDTAPQSGGLTFTPSGGTGSSTSMGELAAPEWLRDTPTEFPECLGQSCGLSLWRVFSDSPALYCGTFAVGCPDWVTTIKSSPDSYECRYGATAVDMGFCSAFAKPGQLSPNSPTQVDPVTGNRTGTGDVPQYQPGTVPQPQPWDPPNPNPNPNPDPDPYPQPNPNPVPEPGPDGDGETQSTVCFPSGWGVFNPFEWVYRPVTCALSWAFVPRSSVIQSELNGVRSVVDDHGVLGVMSDAADVPSSLSDGWDQGCTRMGVDLSQIGADDGLYIECSPATNLGSGASSILTLRNLGAVAIGLFTAWAAFLLVRAHFGGKRAGGDD